MSHHLKPQSPVITLYGLQTCSHCKAARKLLEQRQLSFRMIYVDMLVGDARNDTLRELRRINPALSFPILRMGERTIVGFKKKEIETALDALPKQ